MGSGGAGDGWYAARHRIFFLSQRLTNGDAMASTVTDAVLKAALDYASRGWRVVPLYGVRKNRGCECRRGTECSSAGKHPRIDEWQKHATTSEDVIQNWWSRWADSNVGVHMGRESGLVDFECDSAEAEQTLLRLFDGNIPVVPTYQSKRGKHRLFRWRPDLPNPDKARFSIGTLDVLTGNGEQGQQSVFPPSVRLDAEYRWLITPDECDPGEITDEVFNRLHNLFGEDVPKERKPKSERMKLYEQHEIIETTDKRNSTLYAEACHQWRMYASVRGPKAFHEPDVHAHIYEQIWAWNHSKCRPPLDDNDLRTLVESAKSFQQQQSYEEKSESGPRLSMHGLEWRDGEWWPGSWELTVLMGEEPDYFLRVPAWDELMGEDKQICLTGDIYLNADSVAQAIFKATKTIVLNDKPGAWPAIWNGSKGNAKDKIPPTRGLKAKLLDRAKLEEASAEWKKKVILAEMLAEKLSKYKSAEQPEKNGRPVEMPDGVIWVRWLKLWETELQIRTVTAHELRMLSRAIGITPKHSRAWPTTAAKGETRVRYTLLDDAILKKIRKLCEVPDYRPAQTTPEESPS